MTFDRSYIGYLGFLGIDLFKSVLMYSNGAICLVKLLFDLGLFTVYINHAHVDAEDFLVKLVERQVGRDYRTSGRVVVNS
jgi:hypothetical protein